MDNSNNNYSAWEREYQNPKFVSLGTDAAQDVKDFAKWLRRKQKIELEGKHVLDLGCGAGKNSIYFAERDAQVIGYDFSKVAINAAKERAVKENLTISFEVQSIGEKLSVADESIDIVLDVMSSHALSNAERSTYSAELYRVLKPGGYAFVRTFILDGDNNAKKLIKEFPGTESNTYVLPETGMTEHVFTEKELKDFYSNFKILNFEKEFGYQRWGNQSYKRRYAIIYLQK